MFRQSVSVHGNLPELKGKGKALLFGASSSPALSKVRKEFGGTTGSSVKPELYPQMYRVGAEM